MKAILVGFIRATAAALSRVGIIASSSGSAMVVPSPFIQIDRFITFSDLVSCKLSGRLSQNTTNDFLLLPTSRGKDNGIPNFEARVGLELGDEMDGMRPIEIGISGVWGETQAFDPAQFLEDDESGDPIFFLPPINNVSTTGGACIDFQFRGHRVFAASAGSVKRLERTSWPFCRR